MQYELDIQNRSGQNVERVGIKDLVKGAIIGVGLVTAYTAFNEIQKDKTAKVIPVDFTKMLVGAALGAAVTSRIKR